MDEQRQDVQLEPIHSNCADTECSLVDLQEAMDNREVGEKESEIPVLIA